MDPMHKIPRSDKYHDLICHWQETKEDEQQCSHRQEHPKPRLYAAMMRLLLAGKDVITTAALSTE
jgi:hypothetical protein